MPVGYKKSVRRDHQIKLLRSLKMIKISAGIDNNPADNLIICHIAV